MKKFIQIRGATGSGKTTIVRQYLQKTGGFTLCKINIQGKEYPYHYNKQKKILITGEYGRRNCDGCDGIITNKEVMIAYLTRLLDAVQPEVVVFEAVMYGLTVKFASELSDLLITRGYCYKGISLVPPMEFCLSNILTRNGGKKINVKNLVGKCEAAKKSAEKLQEMGFTIDFVDSSKIRMNQMNMLIEKELIDLEISSAKD